MYGFTKGGVFPLGHTYFRALLHFSWLLHTIRSIDFEPCCSPLPLFSRVKFACSDIPTTTTRRSRTRKRTIWTELRWTAGGKWKSCWISCCFYPCCISPACSPCLHVSNTHRPAVLLLGNIWGEHAALQSTGQNNPLSCSKNKPL